MVFYGTGEACGPFRGGGATRVAAGFATQLRGIFTNVKCFHIDKFIVDFFFMSASAVKRGGAAGGGIWFCFHWSLVFGYVLYRVVVALHIFHAGVFGPPASGRGSALFVQQGIGNKRRAPEH